LSKIPVVGKFHPEPPPDTPVTQIRQINTQDPPEIFQHSALKKTAVIALGSNFVITANHSIIHKNTFFELEIDNLV
jgi:hypothetical protein